MSWNCDCNCLFWAWSPEMGERSEEGHHPRCNIGGNPGSRWKDVIPSKPEDLQSQLTTARARIEKLEAALREIKDKYGPIDASSYTRKRIMEDYLIYRQWLRDRADTALREEVE